MINVGILEVAIFHGLNSRADSLSLVRVANRNSCCCFFVHVYKFCGFNFRVCHLPTKISVQRKFLHWRYIHTYCYDHVLQPLFLRIFIYLLQIITGLHYCSFVQCCSSSFLYVMVFGLCHLVSSSFLQYFSPLQGIITGTPLVISPSISSEQHARPES